MASTEEDIAWLKSTFRPMPKPALPDDCIQYFLYVVDGSDVLSREEARPRLKEVKAYANDLQKQWLKEYIWQRQSFNLDVSNDNGHSHLHGRTEYGDSIEDEWVVVWLLRELTKKFSNLWVKLSDTDGEFLLIEASGTLPAWLEPEVADNRVWINNGQLKIIKPAGNSRSSKRTDEKLSLQDAMEVMTKQKSRIMHSASMEDEAFYRLKDYPAKIKDNMHHAMVRLPRKVAYLLLQRPAYVAPAIEAFYLRDPISLKPLRAKDAMEKLTFPPKDLVEISVKYPRVAYAQIKSQDIPILDIWKDHMPSLQDSDYTSTDTGMKLTCGFEILLSDSMYQDRPSVREMKTLLEDVDAEPEEVLPSDSEIAALPKTADDEAWLNINFEDLQSELDRSKRDPGSKKAEFGDKAAQENLQRIVKQFETFLNDNQAEDASGLFAEDDSDTDDLDDIDSDDLEEDKEASFDEDEFTKIMQEMMGMPPEVMKEMMKGKIDGLDNGALPKGPMVPQDKRKEVEDSDEEEDAEIEDLMRRMGAELKANGALDLTAGGLEGKGAKTAITTGAKSGIVEELDSSDDEDFDAQFSKNILQSFRAQGGGAGPAGTLMAMMADSSAAKEGQSKGKGKEKASETR